MRWEASHCPSHQQYPLGLAKQQIPNTPPLKSRGVSPRRPQRRPCSPQEELVDDEQDRAAICQLLCPQRPPVTRLQVCPLLHTPGLNDLRPAASPPPPPSAHHRPGWPTPPPPPRPPPRLPRRPRGHPPASPLLRRLRGWRRRQRARSGPHPARTPSFDLCMVAVPTAGWVHAS